jgi:hypothetical protein
MHADIFNIRKTQKRKYHGNLYTRKAVELALQTTEAAHFKQFFPSPPLVPTASVAVDNITCTHNSLFIAGNKVCVESYSSSDSKLYSENA